ncbi:probable histone acetyltransferase HAC-like 1 isoform X2 [Capsicum annuum]|uniref:probable histone acetyltransferase HAC-like 1 isoform X2 n=2 Tax=Capsicum annuum TaxID=4072 RepID=UPI001FB10371|nr:probable histone acetyltransferase HAC-like 1 isoform X2 [Capsicum annuum]
MEECVENQMNLNRVNVGLPFSSGGTNLFQEESDLLQLNTTGSRQRSCEKQDDNQIEWTNDQRRFPVNGMIGNRIKSFMWKGNLDRGKQMFNNLAGMNSQPSVDAVCKDQVGKIPSREYQNLFQQEAYYSQAWQDEAPDFLSSTLTPISHTIGDSPVCCSSDLQSVQHDLLTAFCMPGSMLQTGFSANRPGVLGEVLNPVSGSHVSKEIVDSPGPFSSVTVCSEGEWNAKKEPYEDGLTCSDSGWPRLPESVSISPIKPQYPDEVEFNLRNYGRHLEETNQNIYHENIPALFGQSVDLSHLNRWTSESEVKWFSKDNTLPTAMSYQLPNLRSYGYLLEQDATMSNVSSQRSSLPSVLKPFPEQLPSIQLRDFHQLHNGSSNGLDCDVYSTGSANLSNSDDLSLHDILALYINYHSLVVDAGRIQIPFMNYLHSTVCNGKRCSCDMNSRLISHFQNCQYTGCGMCKPFRELHSTDVKSDKNVVAMLQDVQYSGFSSYINEAALPPSKRKRVENLSVLQSWPSNDDSSNQQSPAAGYSSLRQFFESPIFSKKNKTEISNEIASCVEDCNTAGESCNRSIDILQVGNGSFSSTELTNDCGLQKTEHTCTSGTDYSEIDSSSQMIIDRLSFLPIEPTDDQQQELQRTFKYNKTTSSARSNLTEQNSDYQMGMGSEDPRRLGISLTDFFTIEQLKDHIQSLSQYHQGSTGNMTVHSICENVCQLCGIDRLVFVPTPIYCSSCCTFIKRNLVYHWAVDEAGGRHCFCTKCFRKSRGADVSSQGLSISRNKFQKAKNSDQNEESWVQCDKCECWQHQICALYNAKKDLEGQAKYICPFCCLKEIEAGEHVPLPVAIGAQDLPRTMLSDHIEQRLFRCLKLERNERAKLSGQDADEVPGAADLIVRVVLSVNRKVIVKQQFLDLFHNEDYPPEFQYKSKVILLFQKIGGVDVCLFGMYVQEFGSECAPPNRRCVYISYLDSIKFFRPDIETVKGEALRTFVYHEILIGYTDYCKKRGFTTCYIWACPPVRGEDYILYCHPESQKTPKPEKLRLWYRSILRKASEEDIVVNYTNLYDHFFVPSTSNSARISAAHLPYFDGDYWSGAAEDIVKNIDKQSRGDSPNKVKKLMTKRTLKAIGHDNLSADATKDILVMQKLGQTILPVKEDFIIVNLHVVCTNCHEAILSGSRWSCEQCRNFHICARCLALKENLSEQKTHTSITGEEHLLSEVVVDDIPANTEDRDAIIENDFFENRHSFLSFCEKNHYQFDSLRRAKHSSMMILYHLFKNIHLSQTDSGFRKEQSEGQRPLKVKLMGILVHASQCRVAPCSYSGCLKIRKLFQHARQCNVRVSGGCIFCRKTWSLLHWHSQTCQDSSCLVPRCKDMKEHAARNSLRQRGERG